MVDLYCCICCCTLLTSCAAAAVLLPCRDVRQRVERCLADLPSVEVCLNCSALSLTNVVDIFGFALKSVIFPMQACVCV